jgi:hypothetical protein
LLSHQDVPNQGGGRLDCALAQNVLARHGHRAKILTSRIADSDQVVDPPLGDDQRMAAREWSTLRKGQIGPAAGRSWPTRG